MNHLLTCLLTLLFAVGNPIYWIWFGDVTGIKTPFEQVGAYASAVAFSLNGVPACKNFYWACMYEFSSKDANRTLALEKLGISVLKQQELTEALSKIRLRGAKWSGFAVVGVCYANYKRTLAVQQIYK